MTPKGVGFNPTYFILSLLFLVSNCGWLKHVTHNNVLPHVFNRIIALPMENIWVWGYILSRHVNPFKPVVRSDGQWQNFHHHRRQGSLQGSRQGPWGDSSTLEEAQRHSRKAVMLDDAGYDARVMCKMTCVLSQDQKVFPADAERQDSLGISASGLQNISEYLRYLRTIVMTY